MNDLIEFSGIDSLGDYEFKHSISEKIEGHAKIEGYAKSLSGASIHKEIINHKVIDAFEEVNYEGEEFHFNIIIFQCKFSIYFEYGDSENFGTLNVLNHVVYKTFYTSLKDYDDSYLDLSILATNLFATIVNSNEIFYCANIAICIN
ncbi:hypothetical protein [Romboutsia sp.]|uniref:hypothetical protein n=1 Tax=Romboutsia sp. TaxID=1965302 RepID=UPI003F2D1F7D